MVVLKKYTRAVLFYIHIYSFIIGKFSFFVSLTMWILAIFFGFNDKVDSNTITPDRVFTSLGIIFGLIWAFLIFINITTAFFLPCDNCNKLYLLFGITNFQPYLSTHQRNKVAKFFVPDEIIDKKFKCPYCHSLFSLKYEKNS